MKLSKQYYVYGLYEEGSEEPFYIGKGIRGSNRPRAHLREARTDCQCDKCFIIRHIWDRGNQVEGWALFETDSEDDAFAEERRLIDHYGRENLVNKTSGGEGHTPLYAQQRRAYLEDYKRRRDAFIEERGTDRPRLWSRVFDWIEAKYADR